VPAAGGDEERRAIAERREDVAHRVTDARRRVEIDERGVARRLRIAVGHADDHRFLQAQNVTEVAGEIPEQRQFGRAGIAEDRRDPEPAQQIEDGGAHAREQDLVFRGVGHGGPVCGGIIVAGCRVKWLDALASPHVHFDLSTPSCHPPHRSTPL
jgi:hypothetical protein